MGISVQWSRLGLGALVAFLVGWLLFGLLTATVIALIVMALMGILRITPDAPPAQPNAPPNPPQ